jgi:uncharacterized protein involved in exopolysaccharide biosynthesis
LPVAAARPRVSYGQVFAYLVGTMTSSEPSPKDLELYQTLLSARSLASRVALAGSLLVGIATVFWPRTYEVTASFIAQSRRAGPNMSGLAAQLGVQLSPTEPEQSPPFYSTLVTSETLLRKLAFKKFPSSKSQNAETPSVLWNIRDVDSLILLDRTVYEMRRRVFPSWDVKTGIVSLSVRDRDRILARAIADSILALVNQFNIETRQTQARAERLFSEHRLAEARSELRAAEDSLQIFLQKNRQFREAPELVFEQDRRQREVLLRQQVNTTLANSFEQARIDEVRDTPVITVVDEPSIPARPVSRYLLLKVMVAFAFLFVVTMLFVGVEKQYEMSTRRATPGTTASSALWVVYGDARLAVVSIRQTYRALRTNGFTKPKAGAG